MTAMGVLLASLLFVSAAPAGVGLPFGLPPGPEDPVMAKIAPEECLLYLTWAGAASPDPDSTNQTEQLVAEDDVQTFITELEHRLGAGIVAIAKRQAGEDAANMAMLAIEWGKRLLTRPAAVFVAKADFSPEGIDVEAGAVVNVGEDAAKLQALLDQLLGGQVGRGIEMVEIEGTQFFHAQPDPDSPSITWGVKSNYFYVGIGDGSVENILARAQTDAPQWLVDERAKVSLPRVSTFCYVDVKTVVDKLAAFGETVIRGPERDIVGQMRLVATGLGLDNITHVTCVSGLDDASYVRRCVVGIDGEAKGLLSMADAEPLTPDDLASIPSDSTVALAVRMDFGQLMDIAMSLIADIEPRAVDQAERAYDEIEEQMGFHIRDDLVASFGDVWTIYHSPGEGGLLTGTAAVVKVKDHDKLSEIHQKLLTMLKAQEIQARRAGVRRIPKLGQLRFAGQDIQYWQIPDDVPFLPSWCLTEDELIVALFPQTIKAYLSRGDDYQSLATVPEVAKLFEGDNGPVKIYYQDTPALFEYAYPVVQIVSRIMAGELQRDEVDLHVGLLPSGSSIARHLSPDVVAVVRTEAGIEITAHESVPGSTSVVAAAPLMMGLLFVSVSPGGAIEEAAVDGIGMILAPDRALEAEAKNRLKEFGLAMHNHHDTFNRLPAAVASDDEGKPLLSWRVHVLPFIDQGNLYEQFNLDEPWDSDHNKQLVAQMPQVYAAPGSNAEAGKTVYLTVRHKDAMFPGAEAMRFRDITDGLSNTIMVVEAADESAVIWTKPDDYNLDPEHPLDGLVQLRKGGFLAGMGDGAVHKISENIDAEMLNALFTRNGGEIVDLHGNAPKRIREAVPQFENGEAFLPPIRDQELQPLNATQPTRSSTPFARPIPRAEIGGPGPSPQAPTSQTLPPQAAPARTQASQSPSATSVRRQSSTQEPVSSPKPK